jgi:hypothetical protein
MLSSNYANKFHEKGFRGGEKSAFDVLKDIMADKYEILNYLNVQGGRF